MTALALFDYPNKHVLADNSTSEEFHLGCPRFAAAARDYFSYDEHDSLGHLSRLGNHRVDDKATVILHC